VREFTGREFTGREFTGREFTGRHDRAWHVGGAVLALVLAVTISVVITDPDDPRRVIPAGAATPAPRPEDPVQQLLTRQAAALNRGDLTGWLAPVVPPLRRRYQNLFRSLRAISATVEYRVGKSGRAELSYCFQAKTKCPTESPSIAQQLTVKRTATSYLITDLKKPAKLTDFQPTPWESGDLVFAQGRRVTVGAPTALKSRIREAVEIADQAAATDDRFAAYADNRQRRYRLFLATDELWRTWYGGKAIDWAVGYMQPLGEAGADVVVNPGRLHTRGALREVIQHELGHVATISGVTTRHEDMWLVEGVAEYIGAQPRSAVDTYSRSALRKRPAKLAVPPLRDGAGEKDVAAFYAQGHFAVDCLVTKFGEPRAMEFVRLRLRLGNSLDMAARSVFGRPFKTVDKMCTDWIGNLFVTRER
jgi:hypothetical protein